MGDKSISTITPITDNTEDNIDVSMNDISPSNIDYMKMLKKDLHTVNHSMETDLTEIWENLNSRCHSKFGYGNKVKSSVKNEDLQWGIHALPAYASWDKLADYRSLITLWISKIHNYMQNHVITLSPTSLTSAPLSFAPLSQIACNAKNSKGKNKEVDTENEDADVNIESEDVGDGNEDLESDDEGNLNFLIKLKILLNQLINLYLLYLYKSLSKFLKQEKVKTRKKFLKRKRTGLKNMESNSNN